MFKRAVANLAPQIGAPLYYLVAEYDHREQRRSFFRPPCEGMIAWYFLLNNGMFPPLVADVLLRLQSRHCLGLERCLYLSEQAPSKHLAIPYAAGIRHIAAADFFASSGWDLKSKL